MKKPIFEPSQEIFFRAGFRNRSAESNAMSLCAIFKLLILAILPASSCFAQETKIDSRSRTIKYDHTNQFQADQIETLDILKALDVLGIRIHKCDFGEFKTELEIDLIIEEYKNQEVVKKDTISSFGNVYRYWEIGREDSYFDFIKEMDIITKQSENVLDLKFETLSMQRGTRIKLERERDYQFYVVRFYEATKPARGKVPLMIFASSWADSKVKGMERFCGVRKLRDTDPETAELLESSENYFIISYVVAQ